MEFRLNKIDTEIRQALNEETVEGKIHANKGISISRDRAREGNREDYKKKDDKEKEKFSLSKYAGKLTKITIDAVKASSVEIEVSKEERTVSRDSYIGKFIDIRK